jgi:threonine dehydratase
MDLYECIKPRAVTEFSYRYGSHASATIFMSFRVKDRDKELEEIFDVLGKKGMKAMDASNNGTVFEIVI